MSLTFDDGHASHHEVMSMLQERGMTGTFYIPSGLIGSIDYYMTWPQVQALHAAGNEVGGHTLTHKNLPTLDVATATREACDDRAGLIDRGLGPVISFAYPYGAVDSMAESVVESCGYTSARIVGGLWGTAVTEPIPPANPFRLRTVRPGDAIATLAQLQNSVINAENGGGGWVPMVFHGICATECTGRNTLHPDIFTAFLDWLSERESRGTVVRTVGEVMTGTNLPPTPAPEAPSTSPTCNQMACTTGWYRRSVTVTLTVNDSTGSPTATYYTTNGSEPTTDSTRYTGPFTVGQTATLRYFSTNAAGGSESPDSRRIRIDAAAPRVRIARPTAGSTVSRRDARIIVRVTARDLATGSGVPSGIDRVVFFDRRKRIGVVTAPAPGTARYSAIWKIRRVDLGRHALSAVAKDVAGNSKSSLRVRVTVKR